MEKHYRRPEVEKITGLSRTTIYLMMERGEFPRPVKLTRKAVGWSESSITEWLEARAKGEFPERKTATARKEVNRQVDGAPDEMDLRDWFAGQALAALLSAGRDPNCSPKGYAADAYYFADAMLEARK